MNESGETQEKQAKELRLAELRSKLEKELSALLAHPAVPEEFRRVFEEVKDV